MQPCIIGVQQVAAFIDDCAATGRPRPGEGYEDSDDAAYDGDSDDAPYHGDNDCAPHRGDFDSNKPSRDSQVQ